MPICTASKAISITPGIGIGRRGAGPQAATLHRNGMRSPLLCSKAIAIDQIAVRPGQYRHEVASRRHQSIFTQALAMKTFLLRLFTWWNGQTFGTQWSTWLYGEAVGNDEFGNQYYRTKGGKMDPTLGFERRWVIYRGI